MHVTVAICTWNRANLLDQTLTRMRELHIPSGLAWELIVVNNNCSDETDLVITKHSCSLPLRRLFEPKQGHSNARNCAVAAARGELLLWTDDDVLVSRDWLAAHVNAATQYPDAAFFGGPIRPWFAVEPPRWVRRHLERLSPCWAILEQRSTVGPLQHGEECFGANMGMRTSIARHYRFDPELGRKGKSLVGADETTYLQGLKCDGYRGVWVGTTGVDHYIPPERLTTGYVWEFYRCVARVKFANYQDSSPRIGGFPRWLLRKYYSASLRSRLLSPFKNRRWLEVFLESAEWRGIMDVCSTSPCVPHPNGVAERRQPAPSSDSCPIKTT